ncbi:MAG: nitrogenase cofactor biosynthesis protein NifB [Proteobacteria bacterium]|nr:nitrogenase cofactor biosynthesis protein NifB [Pseudomonadota bacterium]
MVCDSTYSRHFDKSSLDNHPCFSEKAQQYFSRIHLPVAAKCNIQCNYCNRKYDCTNESRPGVTSKLLKPEEALQTALSYAREHKELAVIGIAGPGDPLANPEKTFETFRLIKEKLPDLKLCLSTNGLKLLENINQIVELGIDHVTVTVNTFNPETAAKIYQWVRLENTRVGNPDSMAEFLDLQQRGIKLLINAGIIVKINSLLIPGINDKELKSISKRLKLMGAAIHNILPLISKPEHGTVFSQDGQVEPTPNQLEEVRKSCSNMKQMAHCRQCRADAAGKLNDDDRLKGEKQISRDFGFKARSDWRNLSLNLMHHQEMKSLLEENADSTAKSQGKIAVCTTGSGIVDLPIKQAKETHIYEVIDDRAVLLNIRRFNRNLTNEELIEGLKGCDAVLSTKIGYRLYQELERNKIIPIADLSGLPVDGAVKTAAHRLANNRVDTKNLENEKLVRGALS